MDYSDSPIGPSSNTVDGLLQASLDTELVAWTDTSPDVIDDDPADVADPELVPRNNSFLRLVPNLERSGAPLVSVPPFLIELNAQLVLHDTQVLSLFGDVSDDSARFNRRGPHPRAYCLDWQPTLSGARSVLFDDSALPFDVHECVDLPGVHELSVQHAQRQGFREFVERVFGHEFLSDAA